MASNPSSEPKTASQPPAPEVLKPQTDEVDPSEATESVVTNSVLVSKKSRRGSYRPSHKATFIGLAVIVVILAINAGVITYILKGQSKSKSQDQGQVTISQSALDKLGVNQSGVGTSGVELVVNPDANFKGTLQVAGDASLGSQLNVNGKLTGSDASLNQLEAGNTTLSQLNVNGDGTVSNLALRKNLTVTGASILQGAATFSQLVTINSNLNVSGNLAVGGTLAVNNLHVSSLVSDGTVTIGGHVITQGLAPSVSVGAAAGSNGTASVGGNDMAGTVAVNTGVGAGNGLLASVTFRNRYSNVPHVVVTTVGAPALIYITRTTSGFSIYVSGSLSAGIGYAFDYIVEQ